MILYGAVILVILATGNEGKGLKKANTVPTKPESNVLKTGEIAKLIHKVNEDNADYDFENTKFQNQHYRDQQAIDLDYIGIRNSDKPVPISNIMKILQKNYDANKANNAEPDDGVRMHYIQNPDVLEQYKEDMRKRHYSTSSSSDDSSEYDLRLEKLLRRNAVFRLGKSSVDDEQKPSLRNDDRKNRKNSGEHDKIIHFEPNDYADKLTIAFKDTKKDTYDNKRFDDLNKPKRNKDHYNEDSKKDPWDIITKNYDKWDSKLDNKKNNYKNNDDYNRNDKYNDNYKKNDKYNDNYKKKDSYTDDYKKNDRYNDDNKKKDKYNDDYKNDDKYNDNYKKNDKYNDDYKKKDTYNDDYKKNDKYNDNYKKNDKYNDDYEKNRNDREFQAKKKESNRDDLDKKMDWDRPKDVKSKDNWDSWKSKSMENNDMERKKKDKTDDWDAPQKKLNLGDASFEKKSTYEWDAKNEYKEKPRMKTTEDWSRAEGNKKPFVPQISDYYHSRPRIRDNMERVAFKAFGRTSIPFVGKKGIYEEK